MAARDHCFLFADCGPTGPTTPPALYHELLVRNFNNFNGSGAPEPKERLAVYEALLAQQMLWMGDLNGLFCYDASHDRVLFSVGMPTDDNTTGEQVAKAVMGFADLVVNWRNGLLKGLLDPEWLDRDTLLDKAAHA